MGLGPDQNYSQASKVYVKQQPAGTTLNGNTVTTEQVLDTGSLVNRFGLAAVNGKLQADQVLFTIAPQGAGGSNKVRITLQLADNAGKALAGQPFDCDFILSDAASGVGLTATAPSGGIAVAGNTTLLTTYAAGEAIYAQSDGNGQIQIDITDAAKTGYFVMMQGVSLPFAYVSRQLVPGDYS